MTACEHQTISPGPIAAQPQTRLISLDALRGFDIFWIIGGDFVVRSFEKIDANWATRALAAQMEHCPWAGFHFYDLIFPLFVFIVGVSITFSISSSILGRGYPATIRRIVIRSIVLFLLGIFYMGGVANGFANVYFAGVLQRIAGAYFFAALLFVFLRPRTLLVICVALLTGYWALMTFVPVPDLGEPSLLEPGRNLAHYLDERFLPGRKFEGTLLSTMAAVANCLLGVFAGLLIRTAALPARKKVLYLLGSGALSILLGVLWSLQFPIIKLLWTSSYVLVACGWSAILLGIFYQVIDIWKIRAWARPFVWIGMNALTIYIIANVVNFRRVAERFVGGEIKVLLGVWNDLAVGIVSLALILWLLHFLYRKQIFLRL